MNDQNALSPARFPQAMVNKHQWLILDLLLTLVEQAEQTSYCEAMGLGRHDKHEEKVKARVRAAVRDLLGYDPQ